MGMWALNGSIAPVFPFSCRGDGGLGSLFLDEKEDDETSDMADRGYELTSSSPVFQSSQQMAEFSCGWMHIL
jgi:hypothetical protein